MKRKILKFLTLFFVPFLMHAHHSRNSSIDSTAIEMVTFKDSISQRKITPKDINAIKKQNWNLEDPEVNTLLTCLIERTCNNKKLPKNSLALLEALLEHQPNFVNLMPHLNKKINSTLLLKKKQKKIAELRKILKCAYEVTCEKLNNGNATEKYKHTFEKLEQLQNQKN